MNDYNDLPELLDAALVEKASKFGTATLADGMQGLGIVNDGCMDVAMMPVDESSVMVGTACTVETKDGDNFPIHVAIYMGKPGYVLVVDGKGFEDRAYLGDLMAGASKAIGFNGIVVDGCIRDKTGLKELQIPVFAKGYIQRSPIKKDKGKINVPIVCAGVPVNPGDLVVGDYDGVVVIPRDRIEEVLAAADKKAAYEEKRRIAIDDYARRRAEGQSELPNLAPQWVIDMQAKG
ncbi:MAG: S-adenosylmethionine--2-demethylmenaquinone methyltransferase [Spirochaetae bacterium HGW-Spirochaetae-9]|nr:MAG: S-adenosylmethionine--2-demethylmenaquinone methyltransferase [Spirochaetae bacterium HGW-Spirochaetae-9]